MSVTPRTVRLLMPVAAALFLALALLIRVIDDGALRQYSGTALYASMVWAGVLFLWPRMAPVPAGVAATVFCWVVECAQLTGVPAQLSAQSLVARLALGVQFDPVDLAWYPVGVVPLVALHRLVRARIVPAVATPHRVAQRQPGRSGEPVRERVHEGGIGLANTAATASTPRSSPMPPSGCGGSRRRCPPRRTT